MRALPSLATALLAIVPVAPAAARAPTDAETKALGETVGRFDAAMRGNDFGAVSRTIPPKVMQHIADGAGISVDALRTVMIRQMDQTVQEVRIVSFSMNLPEAQTRELPDGTPYLLIPTETVIDPGDGDRMAARSHTLALLDGTSWYLLRVSDADQVTILKQVYPGFAGVTFPAGTTEAVKQP